LEQFFCPVQLSDHQAITPEGYLLCSDVAITRAGIFEYLASEMPVNIIPGPDGKILVSRAVEDIHDPATIASATGKPLAVGHPSPALYADGFISPDNWKLISVGTIQNVRPGAGADNDKLLADLLFCDAEAIQVVRNKEYQELSLSYTSRYRQTQPGQAKQTEIRINHVALLKKGRNGPECAVHDSKPETLKEKITMTWKELKEAVHACVTATTALGKAFDAAPEETKKGEKKDELDISAALAAIGKRLDELAAELAGFKELKDKLAAIEGDQAVADAAKKKAEEDEKAKAAAAAPAADCSKVKDAAPDADTISRAEILCPGVARDSGIKKAALEGAMKTVQGKEVIERIASGKTFDAMPAGELDILFRASAEQIKEIRRAEAGQVHRTHDSGRNDKSLNEIHADFWAKQRKVG